MKSTILILGLLLALSSTTTLAQSYAAIQTESGQYLVNDNSVSPPISEVTVEKLLTAATVKIIDDRIFSGAVEFGKVQSFKMTVVKKSGHTSILGNDETITNEMKEMIGALQSGDKVYFEYIVGVYANGTTMKYRSLAFNIQ